jgi:ubiquinone/menaquinone biosynthesis C-methylase UbiE
MSLSIEDWHQRYTQQAAWTESLRNYIFKRIQIQKEKRILETGCGTGVITTCLHTYTQALIHGLDSDAEKTRYASRVVDPASLFITGDACALPYPTQSFDIALCHFLLLWVQSPEKVLREMRRVVRSGGYVIALAEPDYGGRIDYPESLAEIGQLQAISLKQQGADPYIGRKLASIFNRAGLKDVETGLLGGQWRMKTQSPLEWRVMQEDLVGMIDPQKLEDLRQRDAIAWEKGERILYVPTFYAIGKVQ